MLSPLEFFCYLKTASQIWTIRFFWNSWLALHCIVVQNHFVNFPCLFTLIDSPRQCIKLAKYSPVSYSYSDTHNSLTDPKNGFHNFFVCWWSDFKLLGRARALNMSLHRFLFQFSIKMMDPCFISSIKSS